MVRRSVENYTIFVFNPSLWNMKPDVDSVVVLCPPILHIIHMAGRLSASDTSLAGKLLVFALLMGNTNNGWECWVESCTMGGVMPVFVLT